MQLGRQQTDRQQHFGGVARKGGSVTKNARLQLEKETGQKVVASQNAKIVKQLKAKK